MLGGVARNISSFVGYVDKLLQSDDSLMLIKMLQIALKAYKKIKKYLKQLIFFVEISLQRWNYNKNKKLIEFDQKDIGTKVFHEIKVFLLHNRL